VPRELECSIVGCAAMAATAIGRFAKVEDAAGRFVAYASEVAPDPAWSETYQRMQPVFDKLYRHSQAFYDDLDALNAAAHSGSS
jgi:xylulokinase